MLSIVKQHTLKLIDKGCLMKKRIIAIPMSKEAQHRLDYDECLNGDLKEYNLTENEFSELLDIGFFQDINNSLGVIISDYESEEIVGDKLHLLESFMENYIKNHKDILVINDINKLFKVAYEKNTGVYFFF